MSEFRCWAPDDGEEEDGDTIKASSPEWAAERYTEQNWAYRDYPDVTLVHVRDETGTLTAWQVRAEPDVKFNAALLEQKEEP